MEPEQLVGNAEYGKINYDMATVIMVCLGETERKKKDILRLLRILLSPEILPELKKQVLQEEYGIPMTIEMEKEAENMCNIGRGIAVKYEEKGLEKGRAEGRTEGLYSVVKRMLKRGRSVQDIVADTGVSEAEVRKLAGEQ